MSGADALDLVEAAYEVDLDQQDWLARLAATAASAIGADGVGLAVRFDSADPVRPQIQGVAFEGLDVAGFVPLFERAARSPLEQDLFASIHAGPRVSTMRSAIGEAFERSVLYQDLIRPMGFYDVGYLNAGDLGGAACSVALPLPRSHADTFSGRTRATLQRIEAHLTAAVRLRSRSSRGAPGEGDAVIDSEGQVLHAERDARNPEARAALRAAALSALRARGELRAEDPHGALSTWKALVACRWSLVDRFENDGKRYLVARANEPSTSSRGELTDRQYQVAGMAALGHSNKMISYALGLSAATVSEHLAGACRRLGVRTRAELARTVVSRITRAARAATGPKG